MAANHPTEERDSPMGGDPCSYKRGALLGEGGYAKVFAATRRSDGANLALKIATRADDRRFEREALAMEEVGARAAPQMFECGVGDDELPFIAMERLEGETLGACLRRAPLTVDRTSELCTALAATLALVHQAGWVHFDIKPENIWLGTDGSIRLLDFGLARRVGEPDDRKGPGAGTPLYMAPEQFQGESVATPSTDVYSLAAVAFEMLCARPPFIAEGADSVVAQHATRLPPRVEAFCEDVSERFASLIHRSLAKEPAARPPLSDWTINESAESSPKSSARATARANTKTNANDGARTNHGALVALFGPLDAKAVGGAAEASGGILAHLGEGSIVIAFSLESEAASIRAATSFARREATEGVGAVVHLAPIRRQTRGDRVIVRSAAATRASDWQPQARPGRSSRHHGSGAIHR